MEQENKCCPIIDIDGHIDAGKQFDLDIMLPEDNRSVIYGVIRDCYKEPIKDAIVKLIEVVIDCGKEIRKPVSHAFTDKDGEFVFGPLCPDRKYEIQVWVDKVKHVKVCSKCHREGKCLKGVDMKKCDCFIGKCDKDDYKDDYKDEHKDDFKDEYKSCIPDKD